MFESAQRRVLAFFAAVTKVSAYARPWRQGNGNSYPRLFGIFFLAVSVWIGALAAPSASAQVDETSLEEVLRVTREA